MFGNIILRISPHPTCILLVIIQASVSDYWIVEACLNVWLPPDPLTGAGIEIKDVSISSNRSTSKLASSKWISSIIRNALQDNIFDFTLTNNSNSIHNSAQHTTLEISVSVLKYWTWIIKAVITVSTWRSPSI